MVQEFLRENEFDAWILADLIANYAFGFSIDAEYKSPFAEEANKNGYQYEGGKSDDITVVVGKVVISED